MTDTFTVGQKVKYRAYRNGATGLIKHIEDNVALVRFGHQDNRLIKLSELESAEPPKVEPFQAGWFRLVGRPTNFHYYITAEVGGSYYYTHAFNPVTGEMQGPQTGGFPVIIGSQVLSVRRGDLIRLKFTDA